MMDIRRLIGSGRLAQLVALGGINAVFLAAWLLWAVPMREEAEIGLSTVQGEIAGLRGSILNVKDEMKFFRDNQATYESMKTSGFFDAQDRFEISRRLEEMRRVFRIIGFSYGIGDSETLPSVDAQTAKAKLVNSKVQFSNMNIYVDTDLYAFLSALGGYLPGYARIDQIEIKRSTPFSPEALQKIVNKEPAGLLDATLDVDLLALIPNTSTPAAPGLAGAP